MPRWLDRLQYRDIIQPGDLMPRVTFIVPLLALMTGCVQSLYPFYTDDQLAFDPALGGVWANGDGKAILEVTPVPDDKSYNLTYTDGDKKTGRFIVHLARAQDMLIADVFPAEPKLDSSDVYTAHLLPVHSFMLVERGDGVLRLRTMSFDWLKGYLKDHPGAIRCETIDKDRIVLTAPPADAQAFVLKHVKTEGAYGETTEFKRQAGK
jgi:hypothetical protein